MYKGKIAMFRKTAAQRWDYWRETWGLCHPVEVYNSELKRDYYNYIDNVPFQATLTVTASVRGGVIVADETGCNFYMFMSGLLEAIELYGAAPGFKITGSWCFAKKGMTFGLVPAD